MPFITGTPVLTADGYKPIEDVQKGDLVLDRDGLFHPVTGNDSGISHETMTITVRGFMPIACTTDQLFHILDLGLIYIGPDGRGKRTRTRTAAIDLQPSDSMLSSYPMGDDRELLWQSCDENTRELLDSLNRDDMRRIGKRIGALGSSLVEVDEWSEGHADAMHALGLDDRTLRQVTRLLALPNPMPMELFLGICESAGRMYPHSEDELWRLPVGKDVMLATSVDWIARCVADLLCDIQVEDGNLTVVARKNRSFIAETDDGAIHVPVVSIRKDRIPARFHFLWVEDSASYTVGPFAVI